MAKILDIKLTPTYAAVLKATENADELADRLTLSAGKEVAKMTKEIIREPLAKHPAGIGATGRSYSSVKFRKGRKSGPGRQEWVIFETGAGANEKIREGMRAGYTANLADLRQWAVAKRIPLQHPRTFRRVSGSTASQREYQETMREAGSSPVKYTSKKSKRRIRPYKSDEDKFTAAISAIAGALKREGTQRPPDPPLKGAAWWNMYPAGQGRFDYVAYALRHRRPAIRKAITDAGKEVGAGLISHVLSGRKRGTSSQITIGRYVRG